ncbi:MAG: DUF1674 domain-containing protein [Steroidobacteraceae bacterium]
MTYTAKIRLSADPAARPRPLPGEEPAGDAQTAGELRSNDGNAPAGGGRPAAPREIGGRQGPDPTRYGDWELRGRCIDF